MIDWTSVIVALLTFAGVVVTNHSSNKKMVEQVKTLEKHQAENQASHKKTAEQVALAFLFASTNTSPSTSCPAGRSVSPASVTNTSSAPFSALPRRV